MPDETKDIQTKMADLVKGIQDRLDEKNGKTDTTIEKMTSDLSDLVQKVNDMKAESKANDGVVKLLEKQASRLPGYSAENSDAIEKKQKDEFCRYFRKGLNISPDIIDDISQDLVTKNFYGLTDSEMAVRVDEVKSLMVGNDPNGGYFIRPTVSNKVISRIFETSPMRSISNIETISTESLEITIDDDEFSSGGWVGEVQTRNDTDNGEIGKLTIHAHEQYAQPKATQKMLDDASFDIEGWITKKITNKFSRYENSSFVSGDGSGKPKGLLSYPAWNVNGTYERGKLEQINSGVSAGFKADSLKDLQNSLKEEYQIRSNWLMKRATFGEVTKLKDGNGAYLLNPRTLKEGDDKVLLGKMVFFADDMPVLAGDSLSIAYGDFSEGYTIVDRMGIRVLRDPFTAKPYIKFYTTKRTGGAVTNFESIKILKSTV